MRYTIEKRDDILVVRIHEDMWGRLEDYQLKDEIGVQVGMGVRKFVVDFGPTISVNSIGIGIVVASMVSITAAGGELRLSDLKERVQAAFDVTGVSKILSIHDTLDDALVSF